MKDASGWELRIPAKPERIVSLLPSITASLYDLGAGDRVKGVSKWCRLPAGGPRPMVVGDLLRPDLEQIALLDPQVIFGSMEGSSRTYVEKMRALGLPVYVFGESGTYGDMRKQHRELAALVGCGEQAEKNLAETDHILAEVANRLKGVRPKRTFLQLGTAPLSTCGKGTFTHEMLELAGGQNIAADRDDRWPSLTREIVLLADPEVIIATDMTGRSDQIRKDWNSLPGLSAARLNQIHVIESDSICQPTPFYFARGLVLLARLLHPDRF